MRLNKVVIVGPSYKYCSDVEDSLWLISGILNIPLPKEIMYRYRLLDGVVFDALYPDLIIKHRDMSNGELNRLGIHTLNIPIVKLSPWNAYTYNEHSLKKRWYW